MTFAMWAYPWDFVDEGVESTVDRLESLNISEVNLATNYHTVQTFHPTNPVRRTYFAEPSSYFRPSSEYGRLRPAPSEKMEGDWLADIDRALADSDVSLNSWTIGCHNSRFGAENRDLTLTSAHGDDLIFGLCPSQPDVREYLAALLDDLDSRANFARIELETFDYFYGTGFGWHHEKYHTRLGDLGEFLFGLCFCNACSEAAHERGLAVESIRRTVRETVDGIANGERPHDTGRAEWLMNHPEVAEYVHMRCELLTELYGRLTADIDAEVGAYVGGDDAWIHGLDLRSLEDHVDYYVALCYDDDSESAADTLRSVRELTEAPVHAGTIPAHPYLYGEEKVRSTVDALIDAGAERISFYNYGLLPEPNLEWVEAATQEYV